jgi:hypothetical protein
MDFERMTFELRRDAAYSERVNSPVVVITMTREGARELAELIERATKQLHSEGKENG